MASLPEWCSPAPEYYLPAGLRNATGNAALRERLAERDGGMFCQACLAEEDLTIEHVVPRSRGGSDHMDNLVIFCARCNRRKKNYLLGEWISRGGAPERIKVLYVEGQPVIWCAP